MIGLVFGLLTIFGIMAGRIIDTLIVGFLATVFLAPRYWPAIVRIVRFGNGRFVLSDRGVEWIHHHQLIRRVPWSEVEQLELDHNQVRGDPDRQGDPWLLYFRIHTSRFRFFSSDWWRGRAFPKSFHLQINVPSQAFDPLRDSLVDLQRRAGVNLIINK